MMRQNSRLEIEGWHQLMSEFGFPRNDAAHKTLMSAYSEKHRAYHTLAHIQACFGHLDDVAGQAERPHEIELALWFHDAIYKPFSAENEDDSAEWARRFMQENEAGSEAVQRVCDLIILTKDHMTPTSKDQELLLDIDLSILGAGPAVYAEFEKNVRREYRRVPSFLFKKKRKEILEGFLNRRRIYHTAYFFEKLEPQARENLCWAIKRL